VSVCQSRCRGSAASGENLQIFLYLKVTIWSKKNLKFDSPALRFQREAGIIETEQTKAKFDLSIYIFGKYGGSEVSAKFSLPAKDPSVETIILVRYATNIMPLG